MPIQRAYRYRFYPTEEQVQNLAQTFGSARFVYNKALDLRGAAWKEDGTRLSYGDLSAKLKSWKREEGTEFLADVSSVTLQQSLMNLQAAYDAFFDRSAGYPKFKSRHRSRASATYTYMGFSLKWIDGGGTATIKLAKQRDPLNIVWSRPLPYDWYPNRVTVTRDSANRYFISILMQEEIEPLPPAQNAVIGIDLGLTDFLVTDAGSRYPNPRHTRTYEARLARAQRAMARKQKGSKNRDKARVKVARVHAKISDSRRDALHQLSTKLIRENQTIVCETLAVKNMVKNRSLAKSISDAGWSEFVGMLQYKAEWYWRELVLIDRWYPSSQLCSTVGCSFQHRGLTLADRSWNCPLCSAHHDRDINAAINIRVAGLAMLASGDGVRLPKGSRPASATVDEGGSFDE